MRSVNHVASRERRRKVLKMAKGFWGKKKNVWTVAKNQVEKGLAYAYVGRKIKKRDFRSLWIQRINAGARLHGMNYSEFVHGMNKAKLGLNRKVLADMAANHPEVFTAVVDTVKGAA
jgi:large subunit ribosomal protein L20